MNREETTRPDRSLGADYFDGLYADAADPWGIEEGWYEERKRALTLAALPAPRFRRGFEPGCANGALSEHLASRCDELLCWEAAATAAGTARTRMARSPRVRVEEAVVPRQWPAGTFDLIVVGELAYYLDAGDRDALWTAATRSLEPGGTLLAVHWVRAAPEYPVEGGTVHDELAARAGLERIAGHTEADFRLDVLVRVPPPARSVAERTGLR